VRYRNGLDTINQKYDAQIESKKGYAGSAGYAKDVAEIEDKRAAEITHLRADCRGSFDQCIAAMMKAVDGRPTVAPTAEQLSIIQLLKLKKNVTRDDLAHAAHTMGDCSLALDVLEEIAHEHEIIGFHATSGVSDSFVAGAIRSLARHADTLLSLERTNHRRELMTPNGMGEGPYGSMPSMNDIKRFGVDRDYKTAKETIARYGGVPLEVYDKVDMATD